MPLSVATALRAALLDECTASPTSAIAVFAKRLLEVALQGNARILHYVVQTLDNAEQATAPPAPMPEEDWAILQEFFTQHHALLTEAMERNIPLATLLTEHAADTD